MSRLVLLCGLWLILLLPAKTQHAQIDIALILAVDISYSMDPEEQRMQREGYYQALLSKEVLEAIAKGTHGKIAVTYIEWAGANEQYIVQDWFIIEDKVSAEAFVTKLKAIPYKRARRTSISGGIERALGQFEKMPFTALRKVIDISGDGANNDGAGVERIRDKALEQNITINGLPVMIKRAAMSFVDIDNLDDYYTDCVIGGAGAFMLPIRTEHEFLTATKRKLILEIANRAPLHRPRLTPARDKVDCLIGEKMRRERWGERF